MPVHSSVNNFYPYCFPFVKGHPCKKPLHRYKQRHNVKRILISSIPTDKNSLLDKESPTIREGVIVVSHLKFIFSFPDPDQFATFKKVHMNLSLHLEQF